MSSAPTQMIMAADGAKAVPSTAAAATTNSLSSSLFFTAPPVEASFFSLPYVSELLHCSQWSDHSAWRLHGGPLAAAAAAATAEAAAAAALTADLERRKISAWNNNGLELHAGSGAHGGDGKNKGASGSKEASGGRDRAGSTGSRSRSGSLTTRNKLLQEPAEDYTVEESDLSLFQSSGDLSGQEVHHILRERLSVERFYEEHYVHNSTRLASQANSITARYMLKKKEAEEQAKQQRTPSVIPDSPTASRQGTPSKSKGSPGGRDGKGNAGGGGSGKKDANSGDDKSASNAPPEIDLSTKMGYNVMIEWQPQRGPQLPIRPVQPSTLLRLQTGLARSLGLSMPAQDRLEDDLCLGRVRCPRDTLDAPTPSSIMVHVPPGQSPPPLGLLHGGGQHDESHFSGGGGAAAVGYYLPMGAHSAAGGPSNFHADGGPLSGFHQQPGQSSHHHHHHPHTPPVHYPPMTHVHSPLCAPRILQSQMSKGSYHDGAPPHDRHHRHHLHDAMSSDERLDGRLFTPSSSTSSFAASTSSTAYGQSSATENNGPATKTCKQLAAADYDHPEMDAPAPTLNLSTKLFYQCDSGEDLRQSAVLEWFEDVLHFARRNDFTVVQTRVLLLIARSLIECLYQFHAADGCRALGMEQGTEEEIAASAAAAEDQVEGAVTSLLSSLLQSAVCGRSVTGIDREVRKELVTQQKPDPEALAALEHKMKKDKPNKKQQQQFKEQLEHIPLVTTTTMEERVEERPRDIHFAPCLTLEQVATILEFLSTSALMHWRLICCVLHDTPEVVTIEKKLLIDSTRRSHIPPLTEFLPAHFYTRQESRHAVWLEAKASLDQLYDQWFLQPMRKTAVLEATERRELVEEKIALDRENREMAFTAEDFDSVESAFRLRLAHQLQANADVGLVAGQERFLIETAAVADIMDEEKLNVAAGLLQGGGGGAGANGKRRNSKIGGRQGGAAKAPPPPPALNKKPASSRGNHHRVPADQVEIPTDAVFKIAEIEERVETIDTTVKDKEAALQAGKKKAPPKKGKR